MSSPTTESSSDPSVLASRLRRRLNAATTPDEVANALAVKGAQPEEQICDETSMAEKIKTFGKQFSLNEAISSEIEAKIEFEEDPDSLEDILLELIAAKIDDSSEDLSVQDQLEKIFTSQVAAEIAQHIEKYPLDLSTGDWAREYVDSYRPREMAPIDWESGKDASGYISLETRYQRSGIVQRKFRKRLPDDEDDDFFRALVALTKGKKGGDEKRRFLFHGTCTKSVDSVLQYGVHLERGKKEANFSHRDGFYLFDDFFAVCRFIANKKLRPGEQVNILVFSYIEEEEDPLKLFKGLDLRDKSQEERVRKIVMFFKNVAKDVRFPSLEQHGLDGNYRENLDFIWGPYCSFAGQGNNKRKKPVQIDWSLSQLCVRSVGMVNFLEERIHPTVLTLPGNNTEEVLAYLEDLERKVLAAASRS